MRAEIGKIVGVAALDERAVRDLWPLGLMEERDGIERPKVLVARPAGREQVIGIVRWAAANFTSCSRSAESIPSFWAASLMNSPRCSALGMRRMCGRRK